LIAQYEFYFKVKPQLTNWTCLRNICNSKQVTAYMYSSQSGNSYIWYNKAKK